jgi:phosphate transport system permease protein
MTPSGPEAVVLLDPARLARARRSVGARHRRERAFQWFCVGVASLCVLLLAAILAGILVAGVGTVTRTFLTAAPSPDASEAGFYPAIMGSVWLLVLVAIITLPLGVAAAIILEEFKPKRRISRWAHGFIETNITNLAGVPSVVYGIVGLTAFASMFGLFGSGVEFGARYFDQFYNESDQVILVPVEGLGAPETVPHPGLGATTAEKRPVELNVIAPDDPWPEDPELAARTLRESDVAGRISERTMLYVRLPLGRGLLAGALTLSLVILPIVIITSQEALRAVPNSMRDAALGLGATRRRMVFRVTLPAALPGVMTGAILAMSRAIGEAAPLLMIAGIVFITFPPGNLMDDFTAMPLQVYNWAGRPQKEFHDLAAAGIVVLLAVLLLFNGAAIVIRQRFQGTRS